MRKHSLWRAFWDQFATEIVVGVVFVALVSGLSVACNEYLYDDWRCAFAECRIKKP